MPLGGSEREQRKTVTVLFCDVVGSTTLGERLDPEPLRRVFARYFEAMRAVVERHAGITDKFIGDAVMAVFGVPRVHEDDALRAARAAVEMREAVVVLNRELEREFGARLEVRIGVNSGEVVAGTQERLVAGDTVNVAARLEQAAAPGEILLGAQTVRLAGSALGVEKVGPLKLKGKSGPVAAYRLLGVCADVAPLQRRMDTPIIGRQRELAALAQAWERVRRGRCCELVTVVGSAGVGKSRLVAEFLAGLEATVVRGRCLSYGEGISYWPVVEVLKQLDVSRPASALDPSVAQPLSVLLGQEGTSSPDEIAWAFRKRIEAAALEGPLVVVFDDIHWGEGVFLDLLEHLVFLSVGAPVFLLCMARPELLERNAGWPGVVRLEPLHDEEAAELLQARSGQTLNADVRERILRAACGNPLFVEEMVAVVQHADAVEVEVPPTIQALLASRLDQLDGPERAVLESGAVEGELFHRGAVLALTPQETRLATRLTGLVRKEFLRPGKAQLTGEDAFRFSHLLIRDAAYDGLPKARRAVLHERFADWLETHASSLALVELDELLGYHLEQAHRYLLELGASDEHRLGVGARAAERLAQAGERALNRYDVSAAANLLARALALLPGDHARRARLQLELGDALAQLGDLQGAQTTLSELIQSSDERVDESARWAARLLFEEISAMRSVTGVAAQAAALAAEAVTALTPLQDDAGLAHAWRVAVDASNLVADTSGLERAAHNALLHARRAGNVRLATEMIFWLGKATFYGPMPVADALTTCQELVAEASTPIQHAQASLWASAAQALAGDQSARSGVAAARHLLAEYRLQVLHGGTAIADAILSYLADDWAEAETILSEASRELEQAGENGYRSTVLALLAVTLCAQERYGEAETLTTESAAITAPDDAVSLALLPAIRALLAARKGRSDTMQLEAEQAARIAADTALLINNGIVFTLIARAHQQAGDPRRAHEAATRALTSYQDKGVAAGIANTTALLAELRERTAQTKPR